MMMMMMTTTMMMMMMGKRKSNEGGIYKAYKVGAGASNNGVSTTFVFQYLVVADLV